MALGALVIQHQADAPAGVLLDVLHARGLQWQVARIDLDEPLPEPGAVALAVSLGSDEAADDSQVPWLARELAWLREADAEGIPILGLCFGAQALAVALGGGVGRARLPERGWIEVQSADTSLIAAGPWQGWHHDTIEPPAEAEPLAHNSSGLQAFRLGRHLGIQFHPEVTPQIVEAWAFKHAGDADGPIDSAVYRPGGDFARARDNAHRLFDAYLSSVFLSPTSEEQVIYR